MSATGRTRLDGTKTERQKDDNYETPPWCVRAIWPHIRPTTGNVLDPCCGRGAIFEALDGLYPKHRLYGVELDLRRAAEAKFRAHQVLHADWFERDRQPENDNYDPELYLPWTWRPRVILTNPPYRLAWRFIRSCLELTRGYDAEIAFLL